MLIEIENETHISRDIFVKTDTSKAIDQSRKKLVKKYYFSKISKALGLSELVDHALSCAWSQV